MTRKHFQAIADDIELNMDNASREGKLALTELVNDLCKTFKSINPNFSEDKFRQACHVEI